MALNILVIFCFLFSLSASRTVVWEEILHLSCKSVIRHYRPNICPLPGTNSVMKLQLELVRQYSTRKCVEGSTYGLAKDNSYIWVSGLCHGEFAIYSVYDLTTTAAPTTEEPTTEEPTTEETTTEATAAPTKTNATPSSTTNKPHSANDFCGQANSAYRIIGGTNATTCEFPWMALLIDRVNNGMCGGAIIDSTHILTAAHCVVSVNNITKAHVITPASNMLVYTGSSTVGYIRGSKAIRRSVIKVTPHEQYNPSRYAKDIAILTLSEPISFTNCQRPICLVNATSSPQNAQNCRVMGWGVTSNDNDSSTPAKLLWVDVPVASDTECRSQYGRLLTATNFCAGAKDKDSCQGDSGGPLACRESDGRYYVQGVVSFGLEEQCGLSLGVYTKVSSFIPWIESILSTTR